MDNKIKDIYSILIVDDIAENIQVVLNILKEEDYTLSYALNGKEALQLAQNNQFDMLLLDIMMPEMDGYKVCKKIKSLDNYKDIPIVFLTAKSDIESISKAFEVGGVDYINKPFHPLELLARVKTHLQLHRSKQILQEHNLSLQISLNEQQEKLLREIQDGQKEILFLLAEVIESYSLETGFHIRRVAEISKKLAHLHPKVSSKEEEMIYFASSIHDIGKVAIPQHILTKPGPLDDEEYDIVKRHPIVGHQILKKASRQMLKIADVIVYEHHEKWDGTGYPRGLQGQEIHLFGRIVALADVFDAITHKRCYKEAWDIAKAVDYIIEQRGEHFDPEVVDIFLDNLDEFIKIAKE